MYATTKPTLQVIHCEEKLLPALSVVCLTWLHCVVPPDGLSALKVHGDGCEVKVFQHNHFRGWLVHFEQGVYNHAAFTAKGAWNDHVSSIVLRSKWTMR